jgi:hypothetical protein
MIGVPATSSPSAPDGRRLKLRIGTDTYTIGLENALLLAHALLKIRKYYLASRICEAVLHCDSNTSEAAILLACCKAGLQEYAICNRILQTVSEGRDDHLAEQVEAALLGGGERESLTECNAITKCDSDNRMCSQATGQESDLEGQSLSEVVVAVGLCPRISRQERGQCPTSEHMQRKPHAGC